MTARATRPAPSRQTTTTTITGPIFKVGTVKRCLERNMGTARATYPAAARAAIAEGHCREATIAAGTWLLSLETAGGMGDIHAAVRHGRPFILIAVAHRGPRGPDGRGQKRHRQTAGDAARLVGRRRPWRDPARRRVLYCWGFR